MSWSAATVKMDRMIASGETHGGGWRTTGAREVYANAWMRVREDSVVRPDGRPGVYGVVELAHPSVFVVALTDDDEVVLLDLYRYTTRDWSTEVPAGSTDGEDALVAARRELIEETGLEAEEWVEVGRLSALNGIAAAPEHIYLARGLRPAADATATQAAEAIAQVRRVPWSEMVGMVRRGEVTDAETVAALMLVAAYLRRV